MTIMRQRDKPKQHAQFRKATSGIRTFGSSIDYFCNLFKNEKTIYFFAFGYVLLEIWYFGVLTSNFQIFQSEALEPGIFAQHAWKPLGNDGKTFYSDYRCLVLSILRILIHSPWFRSEGTSEFIISFANIPI